MHLAFYMFTYHTKNINYSYALQLNNKRGMILFWEEKKRDEL